MTENHKIYAIAMDKADPLADFRTCFHFPKNEYGEEYLYFTGNSLGLMPKSAVSHVNEVLDDWACLGVEAHFKAKKPWMTFHELATNGLAKIVGAKPHEVVAMNSLTVNLHLLMVSFYRPTQKKHKILIENNAFSSDIYAVKSQIKVKGLNPEDSLIILQSKHENSIIETDEIIDTIKSNKDEIALILLGGVNYYTGQALDIEKITKCALENNCIIGWDLAHAAGNIILKLNEWGPDFAAWCSYKYLNAGPGSTAGIFVHERHCSSDSIIKFEGWWGNEKSNRFDMNPSYVGSKGAEGWLLSNPAILPLASLNASLEIFDKIGMNALRAKSILLTKFLENVLKSFPENFFSIITPDNQCERGCQLSLRVNNLDKTFFLKLLDNNIVSDWREPDIIRIAPVPLYNSFMDVYKLGAALSSLLT